VDSGELHIDEVRMSEEFLPKPFSCEVAQFDGTARVLPSGELDISTAPVLEEHLRQAQANARHVVVDLRGLDFMDSTGLTLLARWSAGADLDGYSFAVVAGTERIQRLFTLTGLDGVLTFEDG
jgi:anti-sigma B factor antagonist